MGLEKLEIHLLAANGKVERRIRCFANRVTVLRESAPGDINGYLRALAGQPGPDRFAITVDGANYRRADHLLIGFGERFVADGKTVGEFLAEAGAAPENLEALLLDHGLGGSLRRKCAELTPPEERTIRILAATCKPDQLIILNDPFKEVDPLWIEKLAERVATYAWKSHAIVVVLNLSSRPECWIDNELIARIQVGGQRRRTIGFGSAAPELNELIAQVRSGAIEIPKSPESTQHAGAQSFESPTIPHLLSGKLIGVPPSNKSRSMQRMILPGAIVATIAVTAFVVSTLTPSTSSRTSVQARVEEYPGTGVNTTSPREEPPAVVAQELSSPLLQPGESMPSANSSTARAVDSVLSSNRIAPNSVLAKFPESIRVAVLSAYDQSGAEREDLTAIKTDGGVTELRPRRAPAPPSSASPRSIPPPASIFADIPESEAVPAVRRESGGGGFPDEELERRRELIRQRFLEAIERSADSGS